MLPRLFSPRLWRARLSTLRWRLTLFYCGLLTLLLVAVGLTVYLQFENALMKSASSRLRDLSGLLTPVAPAVLQITLSPEEKVAIQDKIGMAMSNELADRLKAVEGEEQVYVGLLDASGAVFFSNYSPELEKAGKPVFVMTPQLQPVYPTMNDYTYETVMTVTSPIKDQSSSVHSPQTIQVPGLVYISPIIASKPVSPTDPPAMAGYVVLATSLQSEKAALSQLRVLLLAGLLAAIVVALLAGLPLARLGLRPLERVTATAQRTGGDDLALRVPLPERVVAPEVRDEVLQLGQSFNTMLDRIEEAFKAQQQSEARARRFAADASHEMRSPLTVIGGYLDVLLMGAKDDPTETERILLAMQRENNRLGRLVVDLLLLARIDASAASVLRLQPVGVGEVVERAVANMSLVAGEREVRAVVSGGQARVMGDADQLYRVLTNLLDNAIRYTGQQGKITVAVETDHEHARVSVTDDGCGIPADELPRIFDRFYRADPSRTRDTGNAGLGLSICKSIVEAHGGHIGATSEPGKGTTVTFELPLYTAAPAILSRF